MDAVQAVRAACRLIAARRPVTAVAIDGAGGAGKSTLARAIAAALDRPPAIVSADDFYRPLHGDARAAADPEYAYRNYFEWPRLSDAALAPLRAGGVARYQRRDWTSGRLAGWVTLARAQVVIVDGVYSSRPELRPHLDLAIFVDTPRELRRQRMFARGPHATGWIDPWMAAEDWYLERLRPAAEADLVVAGA